MRNLDYPHAYEGKMVQNRLATIERVARALREQLEPTDNLPQWTIDKVSTAQDRLTTAMQYLTSRMELQGYGGILDTYLPDDYNVMKTQTHYCVDIQTEQKLQQQRKLAYKVASPILVYSGIKLGGKLGIMVSAIGLLYGFTNYKQFQVIEKLDNGE